ncbi:precorrin-2 dehydrogenase / sirohydrochlorin ferrochelatase [Halodesulfurarchaeum formicicum]|uniref:precorrin-2 dehydrogenase n=1 Tax=Halodesulfurarchaeum formicicum TaxID=1873524 RepID=A0A1D8S6N7_9EURY|nr:bifunctional precorrin-2 dehydrogenase/sirohydrochlorin ferrochelatase [Halodesulfurarchaeum formicicum]AOW80999.1 precorrin-2 dehydrogenase / sirohydrochlorin ferrochelatase [Halodesulfurarchaeum formicicum]
MIPLFHDFSDRRVVIFGGGTVAARKAALFATEAEVVVPSLAFHERFSEIDCRLHRTQIDGDLAAWYADDAFLVIPATDDAELNDRIAARAAEQGALVNRVDEAGRTITPSVIAGDNLTVGIATGGGSPAVSKYLRQQLEAEFETLDPMVELQSELRERAEDLPSAARREFLWDVLEDDRIHETLEAGKFEQARTLAMEHHP